MLTLATTIRSNVMVKKIVTNEAEMIYIGAIICEQIEEMKEEIFHICEKMEKNKLYIETFYLIKKMSFLNELTKKFTRSMFSNRKRR
jgi:hypothetical protein